MASLYPDDTLLANNQPRIGLVNGKYTNGDHTASSPIPPSRIPAEQLNLWNDLIARVIIDAGLSPNNKDTDQLSQAIKQSTLAKVNDATDPLEEQLTLWADLIAYAIEAAGITLNSGDSGQLSQALQQISGTAVNSAVLPLSEELGLWAEVISDAIAAAGLVPDNDDPTQLTQAITTLLDRQGDQIIALLEAKILANKPIAGTAPGNFVQLDNQGKLPAVDGSQLKNLPANGQGIDATPFRNVIINGGQNILGDYPQGFSTIVGTVNSTLYIIKKWFFYTNTAGFNYSIHGFGGNSSDYPYMPFLNAVGTISATSKVIYGHAVDQMMMIGASTPWVLSFTSNTA